VVWADESVHKTGNRNSGAVIAPLNLPQQLKMAVRIGRTGQNNAAMAKDIPFPHMP
jgi:hypothetical protein